MKKYKTIMLLSLIINFIFIVIISVFILKKGGVNFITSVFAKKETVLLSSYHKTEKSVFLVAPNNNSREKIVFVGDSLTDYCEWQELLQNNNVINRGIAGDTTFGILDTIDSITEYKPKEIFIMIGINDLINGIDKSTLISNYSKIINKIKSNSPNTKIVIQSILPINPDVFKSKVTNKDIKNINNELKNIATKNNLIYVDLYSLFIDGNGMLKKELTFDGLHIKGEGYLIWKKAIEEYI